MRAALEQTFAHRATHPLPSMLAEAPDRWREPYSELAEASRLAWTELKDAHEAEGEVKGLLARVRGDTIALWQRVSRYNADHPPADDTLERIVFYVGQNFIPCPAPEPRAEGAHDSDV